MRPAVVAGPEGDAWAAVPVAHGLPLIGSAIALKRDLLGTLHRAMLEQGDVVRFVIGPPGMRRSFWAFFHPDDVQHILATGAGRYGKGGKVYAEMKPLLGNGLLTSDGDEWRRQKRLIQPLFTHRRVEAYVPMMAAEGRRLVDRWRKLHRGGGETVDLNAEMTGVTLRVVGRALFGSDMEDVVPVLRPIVPFLSERALRRGMAPVTVPEHWRTPGNRRADEARARVDGVVDGLIRRRRAELAAPAGGGGPDPADLLSLLLRAQDPEGGEGLDDTEVRAQVLLFLLAGHETTASSLTFALHLLGHHPAVQEEVLAEAEALGDDPSVEDVQGLATTTAAVKEAMRLFPAAHSMGRISRADDRVGRYDVPSGTAIALSPWSTHRHPAFWDDPERYDPSRFAPEREAVRHRYAYIPFGGGPRACIGAWFSMLETVLVTAQVVRAFRLTTRDAPVQLASGITVRPEATLPCRIGPR